MAATERIQNTITKEEIIAFCFPTTEKHPASLRRLFVLADCGPISRSHCSQCLCSDCKAQLPKDLRITFKLFTELHVDQSGFCSACKEHLQKDVHILSGFKGSRVTSTLELKEMTKQSEIDDYMRAYNRSMLTVPEQIAFFETMTRGCAPLANPTREELLEHFAAEADPMSFDRFRQVVRGVHEQTIKDISVMFPEKKVARKKSVPAVSPLTQSGINLLSQRVGVTQELALVDRIAQRNSHLVATPALGSGADAIIKANSICLRKLEPNTPHGWNPNF